MTNKPETMGFGILVIDGEHFVGGTNADTGKLWANCGKFDLENEARAYFAEWAAANGLTPTDYGDWDATKALAKKAVKDGLFFNVAAVACRVSKSWYSSGSLEFKAFKPYSFYEPNISGRRNKIAPAYYWDHAIAESIADFFGSDNSDAMTDYFDRSSAIITNFGEFGKDGHYLNSTLEGFCSAWGVDAGK